jgi:putative hydroxymethylpyrimidine transport system ATP-binding protein
MQTYTQTPPTITIHQASLSYEGKVLFENLNLTLRAGKTTCLLGPSGVGKTTLLRIVAGLISAESHFFKAEISSLPSMVVPHHIAYMAQEDNLLPWMNALDNVLLGYRLRVNFTDNLHGIANRLFSQMGLEKSQTKFPRQLSGGMRQRVALIRTLMENKPIVLMDEPFASVDAITRIELQNLASTLLKNRTVFLVTHDPLEALRIADDIYILAGEPANLTLFAKFNTENPRDLTHPDILHNQSLLFQALITAKDITACK